MSASGPAPRRDTRGIVDPAELLARVRFRRYAPAPGLRPYLEHYWLIDWDLAEPYATHVVPHPSVNVVFERDGDTETNTGTGTGTDSAVVSGIGLELFTKELTGRGRVCGVQFRPGGFRPFAPAWPVSHWTGRTVPLAEAFPGRAAPELPGRVLSPAGDHARVAALDAFLLAHGPAADPAAGQATALVDLVRTDRTVRRVSALARAAGLSPRSLQRLFAAYVGVGPKWVILRYRIHEALERAESASPAGPPDWAALAADLGYSDQAHLVRDFTATIGVPPTAYARARAAGLTAGA
ncbi:helix-turn-helix domain-containing protein [Streptomyces roseicoloratus]|uniref:Helix-turn-helix domain-containing protein n=1 Tax=Streptomyces roseicoloratus TaxID=2508722 RepID=A0ABY9RWF7_9ACTN|nr:helix-turn-helix domain-containing protein [Streptomyces roseicoloratus]WMX46511.1 helix-turn-helix domain-containing protein [Streptomyces roseicoloratus]